MMMHTFLSSFPAYHTSKRLCWMKRKSHVSTLDVLGERTKKLLLNNTIQDDEVISILKDWNIAAHQQFPKESKSLDRNCHEHVNEILKHWLKHNNPRKIRTAEPFRLILEYHRTFSLGDAAIQTIDTWVSTLGGNMELAPTLSAFHTVLQTLAVNRDITSCHEIIRHLEREHVLGHYALQPNLETYAYAIEAYNFDDQESEEVSITFLESLIREFQRSSNNLTPSEAYHMLKAFRTVLKTTEAIANMKDRLDYLHSIIQNENVVREAKRLVPVDIPVEVLLNDIYSIVFQRLSMESSLTVENAKFANKAIDILIAFNMENLPTSHHFSMAMKCWINRIIHDSDAVTNIQNMLQQYEAKYKYRPGEGLPMDIYEKIIMTWCNTGKFEDAKLLFEGIQQKRKQCDSSLPHEENLSETLSLSKIYVQLMTTYVNEQRPDKAIHLYDQITQANIPKIDATYEVALRALSRSSRPDITKAGEIWGEMINDTSLRPNFKLLGYFIRILTCNPTIQQAELALEILEMMESQYNENPKENRTMRPLQVHYTDVISALSRCNVNDQSIQKVKDMFFRIRDIYVLDAFTYTAFFSMLAKSSNEQNAELAENLLLEMEANVEGQRDFGHDEITALSLEPNVMTYTTVMQAWASSRSPSAASRVENLLAILLQRYREKEDVNFKPDAMTYSIVLHALAQDRSPDIGRRAQVILDMIKAEEEQSGLRILNTKMYTNIIKAYWKSKCNDAAVVVTKLLEEMNSRGTDDCLPDTITYTTVIQTWAMSPFQDKAKNAWHIHTKLRESYELEKQSHNRDNSRMRSLCPNVYSYSAVFTACAYTSGPPEVRQQALNIARMAYQEFREGRYGNPSSVMYLTLFKVVLNQMQGNTKSSKRMPHPHEEQNLQNEMLISLFQQCCQDGLVDNVVIDFIKRYFPAFHKTLPRNSVSQALEIPSRWTRNARRTDQHHTKRTIE